MNWVVLLWIIDIIYITIHTVENMIWIWVITDIDSMYIKLETVQATLFLK